MDPVLRTRVVWQVHAVPRGHLLAVADLRAARNGRGTEEDIGKLLDISDTIFGKSFCALGDGAASPIISSIKHFREGIRGAPGRQLPVRSLCLDAGVPEGVSA